MSFFVVVLCFCLFPVLFFCCCCLVVVVAVVVVVVVVVVLGRGGTCKFVCCCCCCCFGEVLFCFCFVQFDCLFNLYFKITNTRRFIFVLFSCQHSV